MTPSQGSHIRYPASHMFMLLCITVVKLYIRSSNQNNIMVRGSPQHEGLCHRVTALGRLRSTRLHRVCQCHVMVGVLSVVTVVRLTFRFMHSCCKRTGRDDVCWVLFCLFSLSQNFEPIILRTTTDQMSGPPSLFGRDMFSGGFQEVDSNRIISDMMGNLGVFFFFKILYLLLFLRTLMFCLHVCL